MDSVTQFVFGAGLGVALLGRRIGPRKAAIVGGCLGTVPDLDVFYPFETAVDSFTLHRGPTHSLVMQAVATPFFGEASRALFRRFGGDETSRTRWYASIYIIFATHALLDAVTVYGTRLFWPIWDEPIGIGALFIIDPVFTIPLIVLTVWALFLGRWGPVIRKVTTGALAVSMLYLGWSLAAQQIAIQRAVAFVRDAPDQVLATATPFNTLFWRVTMLDGDRYRNVYVPLLGGEDAITVYEHPRLTEALGCVFEHDEARRLMDFADGFVRVDRDGDRLVVSDLRMGLTPAYVFRFAFTEDGAPATRIEPVRDIAQDLAWLESGILGATITRVAEASDEPVLIPRTC
jgi:inner membrane protein